jgi:hypothetical protein
MSDAMILNQLSVSKTQMSPKTRRKLINLLPVRVEENMMKLPDETISMQQDHASIIEGNENEKRLKVLEEKLEILQKNYSVFSLFYNIAGTITFYTSK